MVYKLILVLSLLVTPSFLLSSGVAYAKKAPAEELEARNGDVVVRIASKPCTNKSVLNQLKPEFHTQFKKAELKANGKPVAGCWTMDDQGVFIMLENGEQGYIPPEAFKPVETI